MPDPAPSIGALLAAAQDWIELDERWNETDWDNEAEYNEQYAQIYTRLRRAIAQVTGEDGSDGG